MCSQNHSCFFERFVRIDRWNISLDMQYASFHTLGVSADRLLLYYCRTWAGNFCCKKVSSLLFLHSLGCGMLGGVVSSATFLISMILKDKTLVHAVPILLYYMNVIFLPSYSSQWSICSLSNIFILSTAIWIPPGSSSQQLLASVSFPFAFSVSLPVRYSGGTTMLKTNIHLLYYQFKLWNKRKNVWVFWIFLILLADMYLRPTRRLIDLLGVAPDTTVFPLIWNNTFF